MLYIVSFFINIILKQNKFTILLRFHLKKINLVSFASSITKNVVVFASSSRARFPIKLIADLIQFNIKLDFLSITFNKPDDIGFVRISHETYLGITDSKTKQTCKKCCVFENDLINHK